MANNITDLTGQTFGRLCIIERCASKHTDKTYLWLAECSCGKRIQRSAGNLRRGNKLGQVQSCGCIRQVYLTGKYGKLTAVKQLDLDGNRGFLWEFTCDCGNTVVKNGAQVHRGQGALHCGCEEKRGGNAKNNLMNQKFGKLTVVAFAGVNSRQQSKWQCSCECGNNIDVTGYYLRRGKSHCGCDIKQGSVNHSFKGHKSIYRSHWTSIQTAARVRNLPFEIGIEYAYKLFEEQGGRCALSGMPIVLGKPGVKTASLDRKDSRQGYIVGNVQWLHKDVNTCKMDMNDDEFVELCGKIWKHRSGTSD